MAKLLVGAEETRGPKQPWHQIQIPTAQHHQCRLSEGRVGAPDLGNPPTRPFPDTIGTNKLAGLAPRIRDRFKLSFPRTAIRRHLFTPERRPLLEGYRRGRILTVTAGWFCPLVRKSWRVRTADAGSRHTLRPGSPCSWLSAQCPRHSRCHVCVPLLREVGDAPWQKAGDGGRLA